ncbi:hypothetical protein LCGC14_2886130 [marine sediment metagenome]|uniref:Uncharacterized protein n=1 Tax=marine sediment metagenome TaxID=412755 RepID=A0A0F8XYM1_9ZZZZ
MASKKKSKIKGLSIQFMPYSEIRDLSDDDRIKKILKIVLGNNILFLQGRLKSLEETRLIGDTMAMMDHVKGFKGVELAVIANNRKEKFFEKMIKGIVNASGLVGANR